MSLASCLRRWRRRESPPVPDEVALLSKEVAVLRAEQERTAASGLKERLSQLEILLTEHSKTMAGGPAQSSFPSPVVSVVMPTWNRAHVVADAIGSAQARLFTDRELIIIDDGSTDNTAEILAKFAGDRRIRHVPQPHAGAAQARRLNCRCCG